MKRIVDLQKMKTVLLLGMVLGMSACEEETSGPSENPSSSVVSQSSSAELRSSSSSEVAESSEDQKAVSSSSAPVAKVELLTLESSIYENDVYVDLLAKQQVATLGGAWDLKVGHNISLNTATTLGVFLVEKEFESVSEEDLPTEESDWEGTVAGETVPFASDKIYVVQFPGAFDSATREYGPSTFKKIQLSYNPTDHSITAKQANLDGTEEQTGLASGLYSIRENKKVNVEPEKWDIVFGAYRTLLESGTEYSVKGGLINVGAGVEVALDTTKAFKEIVAAAQYEFSKESGSIGHSWKSYDGESKTYKVVENRVYIVKAQGRVYKLKFLSFVDGEGTKGFPQFQYQEIGE